MRRIVAEPYIWLGDEMGAGKTLQAIEAASQLHRAGAIDNVIVLAPAQVFRAVWSDPEMGQIAAYSTTAVTVREHRERGRTWSSPDPAPPGALLWVVGNYELVRRKARMQPLLDFATERTLLILDESLAVKSPSSQTTRAVWGLRRRCGRVLLINGTEGGGDTPGDLYAQAKMMDAAVLGCGSWWEFRGRYAVMGGFRALRKAYVDGRWQTRMQPCQVVGWKNLEDLWARLRPHYLRRTKAECLDLPLKLPPVVLGARLSPETWKVYRQMRDDAIVEIRGGECTAEQAGVRALRLAQITSGLLGGVVSFTSDGPSLPELKVIGDEKLAALREWAAAQSDKFVVWCRFRAEAERTAAMLAELPDLGPERTALIVGGQTRPERERALRMLDPRTAPPGPAAVVGTVRAGAFGLNLAAASSAVYLSNDYSHVTRTQSEDRLHRPGQVSTVSYFDVVACGPDGQRTVDHAVLAALRQKRDLARYSAEDWLEAIGGE